jgi:hypothetical protein
MQLQYDGWPAFVTEEGKAFATEQVQALFDKCEYVTAGMVKDAIFDSNKRRPECLRGVASWDAIDAVIDRAIRECHSETCYRRSFFGNEMRKHELDRRRAVELENACREVVNVIHPNAPPLPLVTEGVK